MSHTEVLGHIERILGDLARAKGVAIGAVGERTRLLDGALPIDSLDLATLVVELEQITGHDPFQSGFIEFRTAGELSRLYALMTLAAAQLRPRRRAALPALRAAPAGPRPSGWAGGRAARADAVAPGAVPS